MFELFMFSKNTMSDEYKPPVAGMKTRPYGLPMMFDAWFGCVLWATSNAEVTQEFTKQTGMKIEMLVKRSGLEAAIDKATGYDAAVVAAFCDFVTTNMWGLDEDDDLTPPDASAATPPA